MGRFRRKDTAPARQDLWLRLEEIVTGPHNAFYTKPAALLEKEGFTETVHRICAPYYRLESREGGRPPVDRYRLSDMYRPERARAVFLRMVAA